MDYVVFALHDGERVHDVVDVITLDSVEAGERRIPFGAQEFTMAGSHLIGGPL